MRGKKSYDFEAGETIGIDKPKEWTSFDVVKKVRNTIRIKKVGHAGTLDPLATGLLIICTGKATKTINQIQEQRKKYTCTLVLGKTTPSVDLETAFDSETDTQHLSADQVAEVLYSFQGAIQQVPPVYSAIKVDGKRAYESARKNETLELKAREVTIYSLQVLNMNLPEVEFVVECTKGTYIRSLVRDIGKKLGVGAYMSALRRNSIGDYQVEDAFTIEEFSNIFTSKPGNESS
ncbi:MAG: tRNA pseudouridine(55) synthase TruB [Imperialibacter sp.]|uniref:tRNA pseudouridine(55) synthase TruB n=1 Tax=Imperialibacter sp. TaxID=2038411 RepID=UPI0032EB7504